MHTKATIAVIAATYLAASPAFAEGRSDSTDPPSDVAAPRFQPTATRWYGAQPVVTDALALGLFFGAMVSTQSCFDGAFYSSQYSCDHTLSDFLTVASIGLYGLGGPLSHATHGHLGKSALSIGIRAAPVVIAVPLGRSGSGAGGFALIFGGLAAMVIDDAILARDEAPTEPAWSVSPTFEPRRGLAGIDLGHSF